MNECGLEAWNGSPVNDFSPPPPTPPNTSTYSSLSPQAWFPPSLRTYISKTKGI